LDQDLQTDLSVLSQTTVLATSAVSIFLIMGIGR